jgi:hypothetical protein
MSGTIASLNPLVKPFFCLVKLQVIFSAKPTHFQGLVVVVVMHLSFLTTDFTGLTLQETSLEINPSD